MLTPSEIAEIEARVAKAFRVPWEASNDIDMNAHARQDIPRLLADRRILTRKIEELRRRAIRAELELRWKVTHRMENPLATAGALRDRLLAESEEQAAAADERLVQAAVDKAYDKEITALDAQGKDAG